MYPKLMQSEVMGYEQIDHFFFDQEQVDVVIQNFQNTHFQNLSKIDNEN